MSNKIKALLADAKLAERTVILCMNQDLNSELEAKERELAIRQAGPKMDSLDGAAWPELRGEIAALKDKMIESQMEFKFRALNRNAYTKLISANPPKENDKVDETNGFDWDEVTEQLIKMCCVGVRVDDIDEFEPLDAEDWLRLIGDGSEDNPGVLSSVQYDYLATIAWKVNRRDVDVPFLPSNLLGRQNSSMP